MRILARIEACGTLLTIFLLAGCSSPRQSEPVFAPVPAASTGGMDLPDVAPAATPATTMKSTEAAGATDSSAPSRKESTAVIVTPDHSIAGKVVTVNEVGQFAVLSFPVGQMPALESTLQVYRRGLKVGELKVTGPQNDDNIVADIRAGECKAGDEVRDR